MDKKLVHRDDPGTSQDALRRVELSGRRKSHSALVLEAVKALFNPTACGVIRMTGLKEYQVRRRLTDLKNQKLITRSEGSVRCPICGSNECVWRVATSDGQLKLV